MLPVVLVLLVSRFLLVNLMNQETLLILLHLVYLEHQQFQVDLESLVFHLFLVDHLLHRVRLSLLYQVVRQGLLLL